MGLGTSFSERMAQISHWKQCKAKDDTPETDIISNTIRQSRGNDFSDIGQQDSIRHAVPNSWRRAQNVFRLTTRIIEPANNSKIVNTSMNSMVINGNSIHNVERQ